MNLIDKSALVAEINELKKEVGDDEYWHGYDIALYEVLYFINTLEVIDPYEQYIQYASIESGIKAHAEDYSFNIESELFNQLTKEQQKLWRKEIEQACISGGYAGYQLAKDPRYKKSFEVKELRLVEEPVSKEIGDYDHKVVMESLHPELKEESVSEEKLSNVQRTVKNCKETVSEDLEEDIEKFSIEKFNKGRSKRRFIRELESEADKVYNKFDKYGFARYFYEFGKEKARLQIMKDAFECKVKVDAGGYPYIPQMELYDYDKDIPLAKEGDKYKVILIKED